MRADIPASINIALPSHCKSKELPELPLARQLTRRPDIVRSMFTAEAIYLYNCIVVKNQRTLVYDFFTLRFTNPYCYARIGALDGVQAS